MTSTTTKAQPLRAVAFFDGQNLYHSVKDSFGYTYPNYHPQKLAQAICNQEGWQLAETRFYTGVPLVKDNPFWAKFWKLKLGAMRRQKDVHVFTRDLKYRQKVITAPNGQQFTVRVGDEKGIDVRIAIDVISMAYRGHYDVALIFSQDQDLSEVADEIRDIAKIQKRFIKIASTYPANAIMKRSRNRFVRGIYGTDWKPFDKKLYDQCIDPSDYRPKKK